MKTKQKLRARGENTYERMMKKEKDQNLKKKERDLFLKNFMNWKEARKDEEKKGRKRGGETKGKERECWKVNHWIESWNKKRDKI